MKYLIFIPITLLSFGVAFGGDGEMCDHKIGMCVWSSTGTSTDD